MTAQLILNEAEIAEIQSNRDKKAEREADDLKIKEQKIRHQKEQRERQNLVVSKLKAKLIEADTNNVLTENDKDQLTFMVGNHRESVDISEHIVYRHRSFRGTSNGMKYHLNCWFFDYKNRWYKNPKTVILSIEDAQQQFANKTRSEDLAKNISSRALTELTEQYPNATVTFERNRHLRDHFIPDRIRVKSDKGSVDFSYQVKEDETLLFKVHSRKITDTLISNEVNALILS
jgi:hypothetical protein